MGNTPDRVLIKRMDLFTLLLFSAYLLYGKRCHRKQACARYQVGEAIIPRMANTV